MKTSDVLKFLAVKQMRVYDELRELDIEDNEASSRYLMSDFYILQLLSLFPSRSFLVFPLSLTLPGKGKYRKLIGTNTTYSGRPVYNHTETGEMIFFRGECLLLLRIYVREL